MTVDTRSTQELDRMEITENRKENVHLELAKWEFEKAVRLRELAILERDQTTKEKEYELKKKEFMGSRWSYPLVVGIFAAAVAAAGNAAATFFNGTAQPDLESQKSEQARILEMIKTGDPDKAAVNLGFLVDSGLLTDSALQKSLKKYLAARKSESGPTLPPTTTPLKPSSPIEDNARLYLLTGKQKSLESIPSLQQDLAAAGFAIVGSRFKEDSGSPSVEGHIQRAITANVAYRIPFVPVGAGWVGNVRGCASSADCAARAAQFIRLVDQLQFPSYSFWYWAAAPQQLWDLLESTPT